MGWLYIFSIIFSQNLCLAKSPDGSKAYALMPAATAQVISQHINKMHQNKNFNEISKKDLFHGHMVLRQQNFEARNFEQMFKDMSFILYHTQEHTRVWVQDCEKGIEAINKKQRSLVGFPDGEVRAAIDFVDIEKFRRARKKNYLSVGTIFAEELVEQNPSWSDKPWPRQTNYPAIKVIVPFKSSSQEIFLQMQFEIEEDEKGRFQLKNGASYEIYLVFSNTRDTVSYSGRARRKKIITPKLSKYPF